MPVKMTFHQYSANEIKVYTNKCMSIEEEAYLKYLKSKSSELTDLLQLFIKGGNRREEMLNCKIDEIQERFKPKITEAARLLKNTQKRFEYNMKRTKN